MVQRYNAIFPKKSKAKNQPVKISINSTPSTMLLSKEGVTLKITQSKIPLTVHRVEHNFPKKEKD